MLANFVYIGFFIVHKLSLKPNFALCGGFKQVEAAQKCAFARAGRTDDYDFFIFVNFVIYAL